jgi:surfeit locus 1 family protein
MLAGYSFRPRAWAAALTALACAAFIALGNWQAGRAHEKRALGQQVQKISVAGEFIPQQTVLLDNKLRHGRAGYEVITPLRLANSKEHLLVNRGWVAAPPLREQLPQLRTPPGEVRIEGVALPRLPRALSIGKPAKGSVRQNLDVEQFAAETGLALRPIVLEQHAGPEDGLLREWPAPDAGIEKHESYSLQWYAFAALALALFVVFSFRRVAKS